MDKIVKIKKELKSIQGNFNPQKSTYKIIDSLINNNYSVNEMISNLSKIKGVSKYPEDLKQKFIKIINDLKEIERYELDEKVKKAKEIEKKSQEEKTKELKDLIDALETRKNNKQEREVVKEEKIEIPLDSTKLPSIKQEKIKENKKIIEECDNEPEQGIRLFKILLMLVIITFIIAITIFFLY